MAAHGLAAMHGSAPTVGVMGSRTAPEAMTTTLRILQLPPLPHVPAPLRGVATVCVDGVSLDPRSPRSWTGACVR